ncbi:MAG: beta-lactamase domain protein, partial [uncultured Solirubrobacteraceae bacterium]
AHHCARQVACVAGRGRRVQRLPRGARRHAAAARLRQRGVRQAPRAHGLRRPRRGRPQPPARRPLLRPRPLRVGADLRAAPAARPGPALAGHRHPGAARASRARGRARGVPDGLRGRGHARPPHRGRLRPARVRPGRRARGRAAARALPARPALPADQRDRALDGRRARAAPDLRRRLRAVGRALRLRDGHRAPVHRGDAPAPRAPGPARPPHSARGRRARPPRRRGPPRAHPHLRRAGPRVGGQRGLRGLRRGGRDRPRGRRLRRL